MKRRILNYRIPPGHMHTVIGTVRSECCLEFVAYTSDYRMFHGLMGLESEPDTFCPLLLDPAAVRLGTFFDIQNRLLLLTSKIQTGYWFFHHIKIRLLVWTYVSKQVPVIDNLGVQLSVVQVVWTIQNHVTIYDLIANTGCLAKKQNRLLACAQKMKPVIGFKQRC